MRLLLDTHVWLWMQAEPGRLARPIRTLLEDPANDLLLSAASSWEIAIKWAIGRLRLPEPPGEFVAARILATGVTPLSITHAHALRVADLPEHHRDPFDRILIAQALVESLPILSSDRQLVPYPVEIVWAVPRRPRRRRALKR